MKKVPVENDSLTELVSQLSVQDYSSAEEYRKLVEELKIRQAALEIENEELRKAKEESELKLQNHIGFYNYAPSGYFTLNDQGVIVELNQSASLLLGKPVDELKTNKLTNFLDFYSISVFNQFLSDVFNSDVKQACNIEIKTSHGIPLTVLIEAICLPNKQECLVDMVDISSRIKILDKLAKSEMKYYYLLEELSEGITISDFDDNVSFVNLAGNQILGYSTREFKLQSLNDFLKPGQLEIIQQEREKILQGEKSRYELEILAADGKEKTIMVSAAPYYNGNEEIIGTISIFSDITKQKKDQLEIQRRLQLELIVSEISSDFVHVEKEQMDVSLNKALAKIGNYAHVDRSYIFLFSDDGLYCNNTHEWCAPGIEPQIENLQEVPLDLLPWWMGKMKNFETVHIPLVSALPEEAKFEREILEPQGVKSLLAIPLLASNTTIGFIGFDSVAVAKEWQNEDIRLLNMLGEILGSGFGRLQYEENLLSINSRLELTVEERTSEIRNLLEMNRAILNAVPDLLFKLGIDGTFLDFHKESSSSLYASKDSFLGRTITEILPEDVAKQSMQELKKAFVTNEISLYEYQLEVDNANRYYENRIIKISDQEALSIIRDITDRKKAEESLKSITQNLNILIQNLSVGTLFENSKRQITLVNQSFCDLFGINLHPDLLVGLDCVVASEGSKQLMKEPDGFIERIDQILAERKTVTNDELYLLDGRVFERDYIPILLNDELLGHLWQYRDITQRKLNEINSLIQRDLGFSLASSSTIDQAMTHVVQSIIQIKEINAVGVYLIDQHTEALELIASEGLSEDSTKQVSVFNNDKFQFNFIKKGEAVYGSYQEIIQNREIFIPEELENIGIIPIKHEGKVIGSVIISFLWDENLNFATRLILETISSQIGGTLARLESEQDLILSQQNFQTMFDTIEDFMFILSLDGKIIKTNPVFERRLGYTQNELEAMSVTEILPSDKLNEACFVLSELLVGKINYSTIPLLTKNGETIPCETNLVVGNWDRTGAIYCISRDITERLKAEKTLHESEKRWHFALEGSGDGVWDWNILNNDVFFSKQWKNQLGYAEDEIPNQFSEWQKRIHPEDLENCFQELNKHISGEASIYIFEYRMLCKDESYMWILDRGKVIEWTAEGKPARMIGTIHDITQRKTFEVQLRKAYEKEKELSDLKSRFVATASHEFRTPLASILMISETVIAFQHKMNEMQVASRLLKIKENVLHLTNIVNNVLHLSKMQEWKIVFNPAEEDLVALCFHVIDDFKTNLSHEGRITFQSEFNSLPVVIDNRLIVQSLTNLISNALKYSEDSTVVEIELIQDYTEYLINVKDHGIGVPDEDHKHMFTPFFRAGNTSAIQGNGLGLSIVMESMRIHGGKVSFVSEYQKGSTFTLHFPKTTFVSNSID